MYIKRIILSLLVLLIFSMLAHAQNEAKTPYVVWCSGSHSLYFTYRSETLNEGDSFTPEGSTDSYTITNLWSGDDVTEEWESYRPVWNATLTLTQIQKVYIETSFKDVKMKTGKGLFRDYKSVFNDQFYGLDNLNTSEMISMRQMFESCSAINLDLSSWDTSNVTDMNDMFWGCSSLRTLNISSFNTSKVTDMGWMFCGCNQSNFKTLNLSNFDTSNVTNMAGMFANCTYLKTLTFGPNWNTSKVTNMSEMFKGITYYNITLDIGGWDTGQVTDMHWMFRGSKNIETLDVANWNTSNVTKMEGMFYGCTYLSNVNPSQWDVSKVEDMSEMFYGCNYSLISLDLSAWTPVSVTTMSRMFYNCYYLTTFKAGDWQMPELTYLSQMFYNCRSLTNIDIDNLNMPKLSSTSQMFYNCSDLATIDLSGWQTPMFNSMNSMFEMCSLLESVSLGDIDTKNVSNFSKLFYGCNKLASVDLSTWDFCAAQNLNSMFYACSDLTTLNLGNMYSSNVTNMGSMFYGCQQLQSIYVSNLWSTANVTTDANMFYGCTAIVGQYGTTYDDANVNKDYAHYGTGGYLRQAADVSLGSQPYVIWDANAKVLYFTYSDQTLTANSTFTPDGESTPATISSIWYGDIALTSKYNRYGSLMPLWYQNATSATKVVIEPAFAVVKPQETNSWFFGFTALETISGLDHLDTSEATDMGWMFYNCSALTSLDLSQFDTSNVTDMSGLFSKCSGLTSLDLSQFDTSNVTEMSSMFSGCSGLTSLDLSQFDTSNVADMSSMFSGCSGLTSLDFGDGWNTANCQDMYYMFGNCSSLQRLDLSSFSTSEVQSFGDIFNMCSALKAVFVGDGWNTSGIFANEYYDYYEQWDFYGCTSIIGEDGTTYDENQTGYTKAHYNAGGYLRKKHDSWTVTIPASGIGTFSADWNVTVPTGLTAYTCTTYNSEPSTMSVSAISGDVIPAETGVLLRGTAGETYTLVATTDDAEAISNNALVAVTVPTHIPATDGDYTNFMLKSGKFIKIATSAATDKMPANKAYLQIPTAVLNTANNAITLHWGETTSLSDKWQVISDKSAAATGWYDLNGRKLGDEKPTARGIYIHNGKKIKE